MKGIELPINILVIVAVAIIVLLGVIALFYSSWFGSTQPVGLEAAKSQCCNVVSRMNNCSVNPAGIPCVYGAAQNLSALCTLYYNLSSSDNRGCLRYVCGMAQCV